MSDLNPFSPSGDPFAPQAQGAPPGGAAGLLAPLRLTATARFGPTAVFWDWDAPAGGPAPDSYNLYTGPYPGGETLRQAGIAATQFTDTAAVIGRPSSGYVVAVLGGAEGPPSARALLTILDPPLPCLNCPPVF